MDPADYDAAVALLQQAKAAIESKSRSGGSWRPD